MADKPLSEDNYSLVPSKGVSFWALSTTPLLSGTAWLLALHLVRSLFDLGLMRDQLSHTRLPKNFKLYFSNFNQEKRRNKLWDDEEYELSLRSVLHNRDRVFHPI